MAMIASRSLGVFGFCARRNPQANRARMPAVIDFSGLFMNESSILSKVDYASMLHRLRAESAVQAFFGAFSDPRWGSRNGQYVLIILRSLLRIASGIKQPAEVKQRPGSRFVIGRQ